MSQTLDSLVLQTNSKFNVYIGDDASPEDLSGIIKLYEDKLNIIYRRFTNNLGSKDLVAHWNRCIDLLESEKWFIMFSDDDVMEINCIDAFYKEINNVVLYDVYHFDIEIINSNGEIIKKT